MPKLKRPSPYLVLLVGILAASTAALFIRFAQAEGAPSIVIAAGRLTLASLILTPFALASGHREIRQLSRPDLALAATSGAFLAIHFAAWITSLEHVSVLVSVVLVGTTPLWVALFAPLLLHEPLTRKIVGGIILAFAGGVLISIADPGDMAAGTKPLLGSLLAVIGAIAAGLYMIIGRRLRATISVTTYIWLVYSAAAIFLLLTAFATGNTLTGYTPPVYGAMLLLALIPQLIGHSSFNYALGYLPAVYVGLIAPVEQIASAALALIFLGEVPVPLQYVGSALIILAIAYTQLNKIPASAPSSEVVSADAGS